MKMGMKWSIVFIFVSFFVLCNEVVVGENARPFINYRNLQRGGVPCNRELGITINCQPSQPAQPANTYFRGCNSADRCRHDK